MDLRDDFLIDELQRIGRVGVFSYDIKNDIMHNSNIISEIIGINNYNVRDKRSWLNIVHPSQRKEIHSYFIDVIKTGKDFNNEYRIICENDKIEKWIEVKGKVYFNMEGIPEKLLGIVHDISEHKRNERKFQKLYIEFQEKERLLKSLIDSIPDAIFYKDINSVYLGCNKAFETFTGMKEKDIIGCSDYDIFNKKEAEAIRQVDSKMIKQKEPLIFEEWIKYPKIKRALIDTLITPYYCPDGNIVGLIGISRDVTERNKKEELQRNIEEKRKKLNELKETDRIKTEFFTNISHELRTPINVIFSAIQMEELMLKACTCNNAMGDKFKYLSMMKHNCYRLLRLINNLIDITKFDSGYVNLYKINYNIVKLIREVVVSVEDYIKNKEISIRFNTNIKEKIIALDVEKIERVILNLLSNAMKFTPSGGMIHISIQDNVSDVCIRIKDTGRGIPQDKLNSIFERFVQVDKSLTRNHEGSGIGLSIVKALVEQHDGKIFVTSEEGKGTEFIINIPCKLVANETSSFSAVNAQMGKSSIENINIEFSDIYS